MIVDVEIKNIVKLGNNDYDCEILHPKYGWIPFTASKDDVEAHGRAIYTAILTEVNKEKTE